MANNLDFLLFTISAEKPPDLSVGIKSTPFLYALSIQAMLNCQLYANYINLVQIIILDN